MWLLQKLQTLNRLSVNQQLVIQSSVSNNAQRVLQIKGKILINSGLDGTFLFLKSAQALSMRLTGIQATLLSLRLTGTQVTPSSLRLTDTQATPPLVELRHAIGKQTTPLSQGTGRYTNHTSFIGTDRYTDHASFTRTDRCTVHASFIGTDMHTGHASINKTDRYTGHASFTKTQIHRSHLLH